MSALSEEGCQNELLKYIDLNIGIVVETKWNCHQMMNVGQDVPVFKLKYINLHRLSSVKDKSTVNLKQLKEKEDLKRNVVRAYSRPILHSTIERCSHLCKLYEALF